MSLVERLEKFCRTIATSGREEPLQRLLRSELDSVVDHSEVDSAGNLICRINAASPTDQTLMVFAHMDQLGMVVTKIDDNGFIRVVRLGGVPERVLPGSAVRIVSGSGQEVPGVMGTSPHHLTPDHLKYQVPTIDRAYIDVGACSAADVEELGIRVGDHVAYEPRFDRLGNNRVAATSIDDRGGCAVLVGLAERLATKRPEVNVALVGSVQEEFNLRGAMLAAESIHPMAAVSLDLVAAADTPEMDAPNGVEVGAGPVMGLFSFHGRGTLNGLIPHPGLVSQVEAAAAKAKVSLQRHATMGLLTDGSYVQLVHGGTPTIDLCWPTRYTHSGVEVCSLNDLDQLEELVFHLVSRFPRDWKSTRD